MRAPMLIRWPGVIRPGTVKNEMFASLDWLPTLVNIAGGPKGDGLKQQIFGAFFIERSLQAELSFPQVVQ